MKSFMKKLIPVTFIGKSFKRERSLLVKKSFIFETDKEGLMERKIVKTII